MIKSINSFIGQVNLMLDLVKNNVYVLTLLPKMASVDLNENTTTLRSGKICELNDLYDLASSPVFYLLAKRISQLYRASISL
jgi:hypothetical protein